ncbi:hypothetical protein [Mesobacillus maritimus]|uniref:Uncharacterized protein n=1 Tax=Mesobacillus maritimus TaxID=1643336 RepID=A0ABS7K6B5_9BACI|nr:hypothetical protein [Mesobacillus maritimus]MBY0097812.1 hypothetical protein [Mesobacillus maritimus]
MYSEINEKLVEIQGKLHKKEKYDLQLEDYKRELQIVEQELGDLRERLKSEEKDVVKLESMSLKNLVAILSGTKEEKLSKEKQEMIAAKHKLEEAVKTKMVIDEENLKLQNALKAFEKIEEEYHQLLSQKETIIKSGTTRFAEKVFELSGKEGSLKAYLVEVEEAISAGNYAKSALEDARSSLEKAEGWGTWDMFGGGALSGVMKHQHIDQAEALLHKAQTNIRQFQKELLDIREQAHLKIEISDMLKFADFFFDGFIADFMVQGKIQQSLEQIRLQTNRVTEILLNLTAQLEKKRRELENIQKEKQEIILNL